MPWRGPAFPGDFPSLGWALIELWAEVLPSPRDELEPFMLTDSQARLIVEWYRIDPGSGRFVYRRGASRRSKGIGKSPLEAAKCISELALPVKFDGWDADGEPVGKPWGTKGLPPAWVQILSRSEEQDQNTYDPLYQFLMARDGFAADALGIAPGLLSCRLRNGPGRVEKVTSSAQARVGQPITYAVLDETGFWTGRNGGVELARTVRQNLIKTGGRPYETTNGYIPGVGSVAERTHKAWEKKPGGILYDQVEAPTVVDGIEVNADAPDWVLRKALEVAYEDRWWVDLDGIVAGIRDADMEWSDSERFFFNWNRKADAAAVDPARWAELARPDLVVPDQAYIGVGFDGSISDDATVLVGCWAIPAPAEAWAARKPGDPPPDPAGFHSWVIEAWERPLGVKEWKVPRLAVHQAVEATFARYRVGRFFFDPPHWWTEGDMWAARYNRQGAEVVLALDTNKEARWAPLVDRWLTGIREGSHTHDGSDVLARHVTAAHLRVARSSAVEAENRTAYVLVKPADGRKVDAAVTDTLAYGAATTMPPEPAPKRGGFVSLWNL